MELPELVPTNELMLYVNSLLPTAKDWYDVSAGLKEYETQHADRQAGWLMTAFDYHLMRGSEENRKTSDTFNQLIATSDRSYPTPLKFLPSEVSNFWSEVLVRIQAPVGLARLHHLLFEIGHGNGGERARAASTAYLELGVSDWDRLDRVNCLYWSIELSRRVKDPIDRVIEPLVALADLSLIQTEPEPGVALHALEILTREVPQLPELPALLEKARLSYLDPWLVAMVVEMQVAVVKPANPARVAELHRELVRESIDYALTREGIAKMKFLEDAAKLATQYNEKELLKEATQAMQAMTMEDLDLKLISVSIDIPTHEIEDLISQFVDLSSLSVALEKIVASLPPSGNIDANKESERKFREEFVFQSLVSTTKIRDDALAGYTPINEEDALDQRLSQIEMTSIGISSEILSRIFMGLLNKFNPSQGELEALIAGIDHVDSTSSRLLSKGLLAFQAGEFDIAVALVVPRLETIARARLAKLGALQYQVQRGSKRGVYPQLGPLISELKPSIDPSWHRFLYTFLVSNFGSNFRNEFSHGYLDESDARSSALVLVSGLYLALTPVEF